MRDYQDFDWLVLSFRFALNLPDEALHEDARSGVQGSFHNELLSSSLCSHIPIITVSRALASVEAIVEPSVLLPLGLLCL